MCFLQFTEGAKLSGKQTLTGRTSGETIFGAEGANFLYGSNLSGKRTEKVHVFWYAY